MDTPPRDPYDHFSVVGALAYGWYAFIRNVIPMLAISAVILVVNIVLGQVIPQDGALDTLIAFNVIGTVISLLLLFALMRAAIMVTRGERPTFARITDPDGFGAYLLASLVYLLGVMLGMFLLVVPGLMVATAFLLYGYVLADDRSGSRPVGAMAALRHAADLSRGRRWPLLGLMLLLGLLNLVGVSCGFGILVTGPVTALASAFAYRTLSGEAVVPPR